MKTRFLFNKKIVCYLKLQKKFEFKNKFEQ